MASENEINKAELEISDEHKSLFVSLFKEDRGRLYSYIFAFVASRSAADDIFQETSMTLWKEFHKFRPGTDFSKWANGIAYNRLRTHFRKVKKYSVGFSESMLESLSETAGNETEEERKWQLLQECRSSLPEHTQELYESFYIKNRKAQEVADESGRSIFAIRKAIHKLRKKLFDCVDHRNEEGSQ